MPVLNFPTNPTLNQQYSFGGKTWYWTGDAWRLLNTGAINNIPIGNVSPSTGAFTQLTSLGNVSAVGNVAGHYFLGNGRFLTGISGGSGGTKIQNGLTTVEIPEEDANVEITVDGTANIAVFSTSNITVGVDIVPSAANISVGTQENPFESGYFSGNSVWVGNAKITANSTSIILTTPAGGEFNIEGNGGSVANIVAEDITATTVTADDFYGNLHGNIIGNVSIDNISATGNVQANLFIGNGAGLTNTMTDRGTDQPNWNTLTQMGVYTVNRTSWSGTEGTPLDCQVFIGLLEVKNSTGIAIEQAYYPGAVDLQDIKIQWCRNYWSGTWTPWVMIVNGSQSINGGEF